MVSSENLLGLYIAVPVYFVFLTGCAYWAYKRMERLSHEGVHDQLSAHYLGGRSFGRFLLAGTIFASFFSGYTVVGVVNEGYAVGFISFRWIAASAGIVAFYVLTGVRLRKLSLVRNHQSPVDFITDRFQSQVLRYTIATLQVIVSTIYVSAQVVALKGTFNATFGIEQYPNASVVVIFIIIYLFEVVGGITSVALTDCVQGVIMAISFVMIASVIKRNFGGWENFDPETFPRPDFYQTPSAAAQSNFWQFSLLNISFFVLPHFVQRIYAAQDLPSLKFAWTIMNFGPWMTMFVSVFMGTVGVQMLGGDKRPSPFSDILEQVMALGGFPKVVGIVAFTASLAAIMSTADSLIIAISQLITAEVIYPLRPSATPREISLWGRGVSLVTVAVALLIGIVWDEGVGDLGRIQFPTTLMIVPTFLIGLFASDRWAAHPWCCATGAILSTIYVVIVYFAYLNDNPNALAVDAGVTGFALQVVIIYAAEMVRRLLPGDKLADKVEHDGVNVIYGNRPTWDLPHLHRFGQRGLSPQLMSKIMEGIVEPMYNLYLIGFLFLSISLITPLVPALEPPLSADGVFAYLPATVRGMPWWAFKLVIICTIPYLINYGIIASVPDEFPMDEKKIAQTGIDPDVVELTPAELGRRTSYDERNELAFKRRSTISKTMQELGLHPGIVEEPEALTPGQRRLSSMVLGQAGEDMYAAAAAVKEEDSGEEDEEK